MTEPNTATPVTAESLKKMLLQNDPAFISSLVASTASATGFGDVVSLATMRKRAIAKGIWSAPKGELRVAVVGGSSLSPLTDLFQHFVEVQGFSCILWSGSFDNHVSEIMDEQSELYAFAPNVVLIVPDERSCRYQGRLDDPREQQEQAVNDLVAHWTRLCTVVNQRSGAEVILANNRLDPSFDPGPLRYRSLGSDYAFRKYFNTQLGLAAPNFVHICDVEFLANRRGTLQSVDERTWFESKQPYAADFMVDVAREFAHLATHLRATPKKVVVLDLDNTLWGGVVGDDGLEGIEIGTTSPRGEAFRAFQIYLKSLTQRGILLAVCSKNDLDKAVEPFQKHPEMVLRLTDIVSFKANWGPKSENIREMATELSLGLDSFVFVDDNPAEIDIVRQFVPEVATIHVGEDPSQFVRLLKDSRYFEMRSITTEDVARLTLYKQEAERQALRSTTTDMDAYLSSLEMEAEINQFRSLDVPRIAQLINKSNQFNLTTRRRTENEVRAIAESGAPAFTVRLKDRFGDHGLIAIVVLEIAAETAIVDTWLMSCRVLKRQVEELTLNEIVRLADLHGCTRIVGRYLPTSKNGMVRDLYPRLGFRMISEAPECSEFELELASATPMNTYIKLEEKEFAAAGAL